MISNKRFNVYVLWTILTDILIKTLILSTVTFIGSSIKKLWDQNRLRRFISAGIYPITFDKNQSMVIF